MNKATEIEIIIEISEMVKRIAELCYAVGLPPYHVFKDLETEYEFQHGRRLLWIEKKLEELHHSGLQTYRSQISG